MKVLHITPAINPEYGGPTRAIAGLCRALAKSGVDTTLFVNRPEHIMDNPSGVKFLTGKGMEITKVWQDDINVVKQVRPDIIHLHALWMPANQIAFTIAQKYRIPVMFSIRGNLDPWALRQKAFKKKVALWCYLRHDLRKVACFHATAQQEALNIRAQGFVQPIGVIPNGVDLPGIFPEKKLSSDHRRTALFLSRLHPGKGLLDLVAAWASVRPSGWRARVVGPDVCGHKAEVLTEIERQKLQNDFTFIGELDDKAKWQEYVNADLFVHPSHSENFGISIAEALAAGVPVITTKGTPWQELQGSPASTKVLKCESALVGKREEGQTIGNGQSAMGSGEMEEEYRDKSLEYRGESTEELTKLQTLDSRLSASGRCGWWIDIGSEPLAVALEEAVRLSDAQRALMGANGRQLVKTKYGWTSVAAEMKKTYEWMLDGQCKPECVISSEEL